MNPFLEAGIVAAVTCLASLLVTFIFNKVAGIPKELKKQRDSDRKRVTSLEEAMEKMEGRVAKVEEAVGHYPEYRAQSLQIQNQLEQTDKHILEVCDSIKSAVIANGERIDKRLGDLEKREKNSLRAKILDEYRLYTDERKNPMQAWSEMEHHSFFKLVEDYESLGGNDYVHGTIIPAMNELDVISMSDSDKLKELYQSRSTN